MENEVKRIKDIEFYPCYVGKCIKCGERIELWYNGGELDMDECCGYTYSLEHARIDFVVTKEDDEN